MDKLTFVGMAVALLAVVGGFMAEGGPVATLFQFPAFLIVFGGTIGAVLLQSTASQVVQALEMLKWMVFPPQLSTARGIEQICYWAGEARQHGFLVLEAQAIDEEDTFTAKGLNLLVDGVETDVLRDALDIELALEQEHQQRCANIFQSMGGYSPTIGIIGAVLGLIQAMSYIKDPQMLAAGIATAFVATIYGVGFANFIFIPIANKLKHNIYRQVLYKQMLIEGLCAIANGESPRSIEIKLSSYQLD